MVTPIACVSMPLPTHIGADEAPTFCGTSVGGRKEDEVERDEEEESEGREAEGVGVETRGAGGEVEEGKRVVVDWKDEVSPSERVVYTTVTTVPPDTDRDSETML